VDGTTRKRRLNAISATPPVCALAGIFDREQLAC
jgi:hypothetical protein